MKPPEESLDALLRRNELLSLKLRSFHEPHTETSLSDNDPDVPLDVIVTLGEVNRRHGTGVLIERWFPGTHGTITVRACDVYGGDQTFGGPAFRLPGRGLSRPEIFQTILSWFGGRKVGRILSVPYSPDDVLSAIALQEIFDAPMCTYVMDDQTLSRGGAIPASLMDELLTRSRLRLAISTEMRMAYEGRFQRRFYWAPPVVAADFPAEHGDAPPGAPQGRAVIVGNIWGLHWLSLLRNTLRKSPISVDWYRNSHHLAWAASMGELAQDNIHLKAALPEPELAAVLRSCPFMLIPTGTLDEHDDARFITELSLPSRAIFAMAAAHTPIVVVGHPQSCVARFVRRHGLGEICGYSGSELKTAADRVTTPSVRKEIQNRAAALAPHLSNSGLTDWLWESLAQGRPADDRFERLESPDTGDLCFYVAPDPPSGIWSGLVPAWKAMQRQALRGLRPDFIVDVGASNGIWSHTIAPLFPDTRFILIEPLYSRYDADARRAFVDAHPSFEVVEMALGAAAGEAQLRLTPDLYGSSIFPLGLQEGETVVVQMTTLDDVAASRGLLGRGLLKVDVQYAEHLVLEGGGQLLERCDVVVLELTLDSVPPGGRRLVEMVTWMEARGFAWIDEAGEWHAPPDGLLVQKDLVFCRR